MKGIIFIFLMAFAFQALAQKTGDKPAAEVYAGYGIGTAQDIISGLSSTLASALLPGYVKRIDVSGLGAVFGGIDYYVSNRVSLGLQLNYASYKEKYKLNNGSTSTLTTKYITPMVRSKINWVNKSSFSLYSGLAAGASFINSKNSSGNKDRTTSFAFQVSPVAIRAGNRIAFFAEAGFGFQGFISGGLSVKM